MNIFVYSDESGVFDKVHNDVYVYGGVIFLSKEDKDINSRKYKHVENVIRISGGYNKNYELKACKLTNKEKSKIYRSLNKCIKFGVIIDQQKVMNKIFENKKSKQRFLDYAYKVGLRKTFEDLIEKKIIIKEEVENIYCIGGEPKVKWTGYAKKIISGKDRYETLKEVLKFIGKL